MAANFALPETKFARFRLDTEFYTRSWILSAELHWDAGQNNWQMPW